MTHIAIQEKLDGKPVDWLEHVTAEQYRRTLRRELVCASVPHHVAGPAPHHSMARRSRKNAVVRTRRESHDRVSAPCGERGAARRIRERVTREAALTQRFAKRRSASRPSSIFPVNPSVSFTSPIKRFGSCWLSRGCFGASQGQSWGQSRNVLTCRCGDVAGRLTVHAWRSR